MNIRYLNKSKIFVKGGNIQNVYGKYLDKERHKAGKMSKVAVSWAGGKDSSLAYYRSMLADYEVSHLLNFITQDVKTSMTHGLSSELLCSQARAIGTPIIQKKTTWIGYEQELKNTINELKKEGILKPILPLWGDKLKEILRDLIRKGFEAVVVSGKDKIPGKEWLGRKINKEFIEKLYYLNYLKDKFGLHPCGENGQYHTFVADGPIFKDAIDIMNTDKELQQG